MANAMDKEPDWIPLMEYATKYGVSLSTLRRHIKAKKILYKAEGGRYLLRSPFAVPAPVATSHQTLAGAESASSSASTEIQELRTRLQAAQEEISELKMLVALYEEQLSPQSRPGQLRMNGY